MVPSSIGPYRIVDRLGSGANGDVYLAEDTRLGRKVAVKTLFALGSKDLSEARSWVLREARAAARLNHPNIASVYDVLESPSGAHIVMEYVRGETLSARLREHGALPPSLVMEVAVQLAEALAEAHAFGVVHRDLKPSNMIITPNGKVKILDFGLAQVRAAAPGSTPARPSSDFTLDGGQVGTPPYMPPEHLMGDPVDVRGDIYSLGVTLYELLTGQRPFQGANAVALTTAILTEPTPRARDANATVPPALEAIVFRAMSRLPQDRYAAATELARDLRRAAATMGEAPTKSKPGAAPPGLTRTSRLAIGVASAAVLGVLAALVLAGRPKLVTRHSIAVLPLKNLSPDPDNEYFSDGITEDIIAQLGTVASVKVISAGSVMTYKNHPKSARDIGRELGVTTILEGSVRRAGNQVRIVSQLSDATTNEQLWAATYDRELKDTFAIQSDVSRQIVTALKGQLSPDDSARLGTRGAPSFDVFDLYLRGRYYWNLRTEEGFRKAIDYFQRATEKDPGYAAAYAGLADAYDLLGMYGFMPIEMAASRARTAALKALELDATLAEAHASLALLQNQSLDFAGAEAGFRRALELNPNYATAHHWYANYLSQIGRMEAAQTEIRRAQELDPLSVAVSWALGNILYLARRYDDAVASLDATLKMDPHFAPAHGTLAQVHAETGASEKAVAEVERSQGTPEGERRALLAYVYARAGRSNEAMSIVNGLVADKHVAPSSLAVVYAALTRTDEAFRWLQRAHDVNDMTLAYLKVDPRFDPLRSDRRFDAMLRAVGLTGSPEAVAPAQNSPSRPPRVGLVPEGPISAMHERG